MEQCGYFGHDPKRCERKTKGVSKFGGVEHVRCSVHKRMEGYGDTTHNCECGKRKKLSSVVCRTCSHREAVRRNNAWLREHGRI